LEREDPNTSWVVDDTKKKQKYIYKNVVKQMKEKLLDVETGIKMSNRLSPKEETREK